jgi:hypothetical protein
MIKVLRKLKGRSLTELRVRVAQAAASLAERSGVSAQSRIPSDAAFFRLLDASRSGDAPVSAASLLERFRTRAAANFFAAFDAPAETRALLRSRFGGRAAELLVERAEQIVAGRFSLLGLHDLDFGDPIDWRLEPVTGKRSPLAHWSRINYLDAEVAGDKKITWELNRQQYFQVLGRAYWHTGDERYAETFARHLHEWTEANPPKLGINWASSLEVAFRAISWLWSLRFFKDSPHLSPALYLRALKFLHAHARHLETYLSTYFSPNTHLTGEALGLFYLGTQLPEFRAAARWRETGASILLRQLESHVRPDGVYFEQSSYYHRYTTDFYIHFLLLLKASGAPREAIVEKKLSALLDHLMHLTLPDGTTPLFGDDDGGRLAWLDERPADDFRATLATGASLFKRADYKFIAASVATEETLWLTGARGLREFDELAAVPPAEGSRAFADGGYYVMRDGWTAESNCLLIDCGPHGSLNGAHAHADALSLVTLAARGRTVLVDSGTYTYTGSPAERDEFRATAAHNTLTVDGPSSSVAESAFRWRQAARAACRVWLSRPRFDLFEGEHDGYLRLQPAPVRHARSVLFLKGDYWIVRDRVESVSAHDYALHFHFAPRSDPSIETAQATPFVREGETPGLTLYTFARAGAWQRHDELVSACYGSAVRAPVCTYAFSGKAEETVTLLLPRASQEKDDAARVSAREIEAVGGRAFELMNGATRDCLLLRAPGAPVVETARFTSGFDWTWLRFRGDESEPQELIAIDGQTLRIDGREMLRTAAPTGYLAARRAGQQQWHVESDTGENLFLAPTGAEESLFVGGVSPHDEQRGESLLVSSGE